MNKCLTCVHRMRTDLRRHQIPHLHDLILRQTTGMLGALHGFTAVALVGVFDVRQSQGPAAVLVAGEFGYEIVSCSSSKDVNKLTNRSLGVCALLKLNHTSSARAAIGLVLNLCTLNLADCREELNEILIARRPGKVADVDEVARFSTRSSKVCEGVGWSCGCTGIEATAVAWTTEATAAAEAASKAAAACESSTGTEAAAKAATCSAETAATTKARSTSETVFTNLEIASLPVVAVELVDGVPRIVDSLECYNTRPLRATIGRNVNIGAKNGTGVSSLAEQVLQILPANIVRELEFQVSK